MAKFETELSLFVLYISILSTILLYCNVCVCLGKLVTVSRLQSVPANNHRDSSFEYSLSDFFLLPLKTDAYAKAFFRVSILYAQYNRTKTDNVANCVHAKRMENERIISRE